MGAHVTKLVLENADKTERRDVLHHWFAKTTVGHYNILIVILYIQIKFTVKIYLDIIFGHSQCALMTLWKMDVKMWSKTV